MDYFGYIFLALVICIIFGALSARMVKLKGYGVGTAVLYFFFGFMFPLIGLLLAVGKEDLTKPRNTYQQMRGNAADELKKLKELRDMGVINDYEYNVKRDELVKRL